MDVRCEKCQTEYELDESRLKPGGVTVKCTNCGHMFKIRKRASTNVGVPAAAPDVPAAKPAAPAKPATPPTPMAAQPAPRAASHSDAPLGITDVPSGPNSQRQWLVRLENGETKACRELAALQQWIVAGVVSRESLISRSGKTWKRLGDIGELSQYFVIADEAKAQRSAKPTGPTGSIGKPAAAAGTMLGVGMARASTNDEEEGRSTGSFRARQPTPPPPPAVKPIATAQTELAPSGPHKRPATQPTPPPGKKIDIPPGRATAAWASNDIKASESMAAMPQGPRGGKLSASPDEPAFAGKVRVDPSDRSTFNGKVASDIDDDDDVYQPSRGSRAGMWIALVALLVIGAAAGAVYMFVFKGGKQEPVAEATKQDAGVMVAGDAQTVVVTPLTIDAQVETASPLDGARGELVAGVHTRMKTALDALKSNDDPGALAMRARLMTNLAQGMQDRAGFVDKAEAEKLRKEAKQIVIDAAPLAQRAIAGQADNVDANLAMADVMRLQGKPAPSVKRYITAAKGKGDKAQAASVALSEALLAMRDGKLADAQSALAGVLDAPDDMRVKLALAQVAYAQNKQPDAKAQVDQILATQPDHDAALAMYKKLETVVAKDDPLPPEETKPNPGTGAGSATKPAPTGGGGGGDYDSLLAQANKVAESNCSKAMDLYDRALQQKPQGVEALTGTGYCHLDRKEFSSAFSKFRAALLVSPRYEPALGGIAETYQRQGNKAAAIEAWNKYLEVFPASPKAKKQLEILGAGDAPKPPEPEKKPEETPPPAPSPETPAAGSASN